MCSISWKVTSRPGLSKTILWIREKVVCLKEDKQLFGDTGLHSLRDERRNINRVIV